LLGAVAVVVGGVGLAVGFLTPGGIRGVLLSMPWYAGSAALLILLYRAPRVRTLAALGLVALVTADLLWLRQEGNYARTVDIHAALDPPAAVAAIADRDRYRVMSLVPSEQGLNPTTTAVPAGRLSAWWGLRSTDVWMSLMLHRNYLLRERRRRTHPPSRSAGRAPGVLSAMNVGYLVAPVDLALTGWETVFEDARVRIVRNPRPLPHAFLVGQTIPEGTTVRPEWNENARSRLDRYSQMVKDWSEHVSDAVVLDRAVEAEVDYATTAVIADPGLGATVAPDPLATLLRNRQARTKCASRRARPRPWCSCSQRTSIRDGPRPWTADRWSCLASTGSAWGSAYLPGATT
jgi:hypothetical protein